MVGGGVMRPRGSVIRLVVERKMTAPRTGDRQFPGGTETATSHSPGSAQRLVGRVSLLTPPPPLLQHAHITSGNV